MYQKPSSLWASAEFDFVVDPSQFSFASFGNEYVNWLHKCKRTNWVKIEEQYYWFNGSQDSLRVNSHEYHKLF